MLDHACRLSLEGLCLQAPRGRYLSGRSASWIKWKCSDRQEFVIAGYVPSTVARRSARWSLGVYEGANLRYVGRVGTGFTSARRRDVRSRARAAAAHDASLRRQTPRPRRRAASVSFGPSWSPRSTSAAGPATASCATPPSTACARTSPRASVAARDRPSAANAAPERRQVTLTHPDRVYWPEDGVTKQGLADYYAEAWPRMTPFVRRPAAGAPALPGRNLQAKPSSRSMPGRA